MKQIIKYQYRTVTGARRGNEVEFDDHYGIGSRDKFRFAFQHNGRLLMGQAAYDKLMEPIFDGKTFLDLIPNFITPVSLVPNPNYVYGMGEKFKTMPNPQYPAQVAQLDAQKEYFSQLLHSVLTLVCQVQWPRIPDTGRELKWYLKDGEQWVDIIVVPGLYPGGRKWVTVTEEDHPQYASFVNHCMGYKSKEDMLKLLVRI